MKKVKGCPFCEPEKDDNQAIRFENEYCWYLQHPQHQDILEGSGLIVPKQHRQTVFDLSPEEWNATYKLMQKVKEYADEKYSPDGYTLGWNFRMLTFIYYLDLQMNLLQVKEFALGLSQKKIEDLEDNLYFSIQHTYFISPCAT